ncbi:MAG: hypothetical protein LBU15_01305 [Rickettsiales bacterium]|nr:hypothetical protein [Rickettsiales bacterium]
MKKVLVRFFILLAILAVGERPHSDSRAANIGISIGKRNKGKLALSNEEIIGAKRNGIVAAICYVTDIITGKVARAIIAVAVFAVGWMFILGGVKWTTIFMFTIACSLTFGGAELAHIISRNNYSCRSLEEAEEISKSIVYNEGLCSLNSAKEYAPGQVWYLCLGSNDSECRTKVTSNTYIDESAARSIVALVTCQAGFFKFDETKLHKEKCNKDKSNVGYFSVSDDQEDAKCKKGCLRSDLQKFYDSYNLKPARDSVGDILILPNDSAKYGRTEGVYYVQGTILDMDCKDGFVEFNDKDVADSKAAKLTCSDGGSFKIDGNCKRRCALDKFNNYAVVSGWQRCDADTNNCKSNGSDLVFGYGETAKITGCASGHLMIESTNPMVISCDSSGFWKKVRGQGCTKACRLDALELRGDSGWKSCSGSTCSGTISNGKVEFKDGEAVAVSGSCKPGYSVNTSGSSLLKYSCLADGSWQEDNGTRCFADCKLGDKDNMLKGEENTTTWALYSQTTQTYSSTVTATNTLKNGEKIRPKVCKTGYNVDADGSIVYLCDKGKFSVVGGNVSEYCRQGCKFENLDALVFNDISYSTEKTIKEWVACATDGSGGGCVDIKTSTQKGEADREIIDMTKTADTGRYAFLDSYYRIEKCDERYEKFSEDHTLAVRCSEGGRWVIDSNDWNACRLIPKCYEFSTGTSARKIDLTSADERIDNIRLQLWGASGGTACNNSSPNRGGYSEGTLKISSSRVFYVTVGGKGTSSTCGIGSGGAGGFNGGGDGGSSTTTNTDTGPTGPGGGGGGATDLRLTNVGLSDRVAVAGGGGGTSGRLVDSSGGGGGGTPGSSNSDSVYGSGGGTGSAGGQPGTSINYARFASQGILGQGGHGAGFKDSLWYGAGGGGGGYYGGGGAITGTAGGGSGYINTTYMETGSGQTSTNSPGPDDGFARICWGDWYRQTNPCSQPIYSKYESDSNKTPCEKGDEIFPNVSLPTANRCSRASLIDLLQNKNSVVPSDASTRLPAYYSEGMKVHQACSEGYTVEGGEVGMMVYQCNSNSTWTVANGDCKPNSCDNAKALTVSSTNVDYHIVVPAGETESGKDKIFECASGYSGSLTQSCSLGVWSYASGVCYKNCGDVTAVVEGGTWDYGQDNPKAHNSKATLKCENGLNGAAREYTCNDGSWSNGQNASTTCVKVKPAPP